MDKTYSLKITSQAEKQMQETIHSITNDLKAPDTALHLLNALENSFTSLAHFPQRVVLVDEESWHTKGIHRLPVKNFLVYLYICLFLVGGMVL